MIQINDDSAKHIAEMLYRARKMGASPAGTNWESGYVVGMYVAIEILGLNSVIGRDIETYLEKLEYQRTKNSRNTMVTGAVV